MINAGAIATAGLIAGKNPNSRFKRVMDSVNPASLVRTMTVVYDAEQAAAAAIAAQ